jgi:hypothetical protein
MKYGFPSARVGNDPGGEAMCHPQCLRPSIPCWNSNTAAVCALKRGLPGYLWALCALSGRWASQRGVDHPHVGCINAIAKKIEVGAQDVCAGQFGAGLPKPSLWLLPIGRGPAQYAKALCGLIIILTPPACWCWAWAAKTTDRALKKVWVLMTKAVVNSRHPGGGDEVDTALSILRSCAKRPRPCIREPVPASGSWCCASSAGFDGFSGITANPWLKPVRPDHRPGGRRYLNEGCRNVRRGNHPDAALRPKEVLTRRSN